MKIVMKLDTIKFREFVRIWYRNQNIPVQLEHSLIFEFHLPEPTV